MLYLFELYKENPAIHRYIGEKGWMEYFTISSHNCEYSLLHQNSKSGRFLKVSCRVNFETISMNFLCSVRLKSHWFILHFEWVFDLVYDFITSYTGHLKNNGLLSLHIFQMLIYVFIQITLINMTSNLIKKVFKNWKAVKILVLSSSFS